ncbi:MAG: type II toxin-antitoxin system Phd/YefM family antitoxin [Planctomycetes bacterium]|nr:type II toxin-antitoxin system Phd/YefM family antitoxin [Planctomycetota bacterium]
MMRTLTASDFKARCLAVLDEIARTGEPITITKRGRPVARLVAPLSISDDRPQSRLRGTLRIVGDIVSSVLPPDAWEAERKR